MELYERIALARRQAGLSQEQLGEKLGVSRQAVSKWESNQTNPDVAYVAAMCRLFGVSSDWLLLGEETSQETAPAHCPACQAIVTGLDNFCPNCGKNLKSAVSPTYTLVLKNGEQIGHANNVLIALSKTDLFPEDAILSRFVDPVEAPPSIPCILARGLSKTQMGEIEAKIREVDSAAMPLFVFFRDSAGETVEELFDKEPLPKEIVKSGTGSGGMTFGTTVLAVILGVVGAILLLSIF